METAALLMNIAMSKTLLNWIKAKHPASILGIFVPPLVLGINLSCCLASYFSPEDALMPHSYRWVLEKSNFEIFFLKERSYLQYHGVSPSGRSLKRRCVHKYCSEFQNLRFNPIIHSLCILEGITAGIVSKAEIQQDSGHFGDTG